MAVQQYQLIFNCTLAQFLTAKSTTLPGAGFTVIALNGQAGIIVGSTFTSTVTTNTNTALTAISNPQNYYVGMPISGAGIPAGTTIAAVNIGAATATMSQAATASATITATLGQIAGQIDFSYDGAYFLTFFGANPAPVATQPQAGIPVTQISPTLLANLTNVLASTLGAPVPPNLAVPPAYVP